VKVAQLREHARELGFTPQDQVRWLAPVELARTALQVALASAFSTFTDKRELQRSFPADTVALPADDAGEAWFDFVADIGDGFDPTYTVALQLAAERLDVAGADAATTSAAAPGATVDVDAAGHDLPRGRLLILGGDEVYPTASSTAYEDRMKGPYRTALSAVETAGAPPLMLSLPGNHDWYDGLTAFLRVFGQRRRIGGWQTAQQRSYFVVKLPHNWWLVGLDSQLGTEIDDPQLDYFRQQLTEHLQPGDGVILCCASPAWVHTPYDAAAFDSLHYFERTIVRQRLDPVTGDFVDTGARVRLWLTGDHHHYARYEEEGAGVKPGAARQLVTCGLGGAYLAFTHRLPEHVELPPPASTVARPGEPTPYRLAARYPDAPTSRRLVRGLFAGPPRGLPFRNPGFWRLAGGVHAALFVILSSLLGLAADLPPTQALRQSSLGDAGRLGFQLGIWLCIGLVLWSLLPLRHLRRPRGLSPVAVLLVIQLALAIAGLAATVWLIRAITLPGWFPGGRSLPDFVLFGVALVLSGVVVGLAGSYGAAAAIVLGNDLRVADWQASAQAIEEHKGFLRLRVDAAGLLTVYPVVFDQVCHDWDLAPARAAGGVRPVPAGDPPVARLAEAPIVVARTSGAVPHRTIDVTDAGTPVS
jgi:hypothetical protein